jgi:hypothetical protein
MIGSASKVRQIFRTLLKEGAAPETLQQVHAPIGLDLGAETPDEIALSIAAELQMWRRGGTGASLREQVGILASLRGDAGAATLEDAIEEDGDTISGGVTRDDPVHSTEAY